MALWLPHTFVFNFCEKQGYSKPTYKQTQAVCICLRDVASSFSSRLMTEIKKFMDHLTSD